METVVDGFQMVASGVYLCYLLYSSQMHWTGSWARDGRVLCRGLVLDPRLPFRLMTTEIGYQ